MFNKPVLTKGLLLKERICIFFPLKGAPIRIDNNFLKDII